ncbi:APC family permease [Sphingomonas sp. SUN019]|uniref:APC family permease n=1 Tax=Sphingomonas sp. SUN019 TaxID=2937788 RepID=UPI002164B768|nr:APC family permease [Sphingomonas sp. SUN019]UVO49221.1 APC family permease [Sphingomonas sp. SUN019]
MLEGQIQPASAPKLARRLGMTGVLFLTLSVATPASSVFVIAPGMLQTAGTGAVWALAIAAVVCVMTAFIYAELSSVWPVSGGEYVAVAHTMGPLAGFVMLGVSVFNNLFFPPVAGLGIAAVLSTVIPGLPAVPIAVAVVAGATLVALLDIRVNAAVTGVFLLVETLALVAVVVLGFGEAMRPVSEFLLNPVMLDGEILVPSSPAAIGLATSIAIFALNGYGVAVYFGEEMHEAPRRIAKAILWALALTLVFEGLPILAALTGAIDLRAFLAAEDPFGLLVATRGGGTAAAWVSVAVVIAIVNAVIACVLACARFFYSTGRDRSWGRRVDAWLSAVHPRFGSPHVGTLLVGGIGIACCFLPLQLLLVLSGTGLVAIYAGIALAVIAGRRSGRTDGAHYRMPLYPLAPIVTLVALGYVVWTSWLDLEEGRPGLMMTGVQILLSAGYYWFVVRRRGKWEVHA